MNNLKTFTYHYILDKKKKIQNSILGPTQESFYKQIKFLKQNYNIISPNEIKNNNKGDVLLTFDDGLKDHINIVSPILDEFNIKGLFFIPTCILDEVPCIPVYIHYSLALLRVKKFQSILDIYFEKNKIKKKFKNASNSFEKIKEIKHFFKFELDHKECINIVRYLKRYLEETYPNLFYHIFLTEKEIKDLSEHGHFISCHTYSHPSLGHKYKLDFLIKEIKLAKQSLEKLIGKSNSFFCLPYGTPEDCVDLNFDLFIDSKIEFLFKCYPCEPETVKSLNILGRKSVFMNHQLKDLAEYLDN